MTGGESRGGEVEGVCEWQQGGEGVRGERKGVRVRKGARETRDLEETLVCRDRQRWPEALARRREAHQTS